MKKTLFTAIVLAGITFNQGLAADKLKSFDHAAELTSQAKTILFQELNIAKVPNSGHQQIVCLAENIYFEARAESMEGKAGVANVTRNRVNDARWPSTYCEVVQQGPVRESWKTKKNPDLADEDRVYYPRKHRCQFSWYCDGKSDKPKDNMSWIVAQVVAYNTLYGYHKDNTHGATHYHATYVNPWWRKHYDKTVAHGSHIFYK